MSLICQLFKGRRSQKNVPAINPEEVPKYYWTGIVKRNLGNCFPKRRIFFCISVSIIIVFILSLPSVNDADYNFLKSAVLSFGVLSFGACLSALGLFLGFSDDNLKRNLARSPRSRPGYENRGYRENAYVRLVFSVLWAATSQFFLICTTLSIGLFEPVLRNCFNVNNLLYPFNFCIWAIFCLGFVVLSYSISELFVLLQTLYAISVDLIIYVKKSDPR